MKSLVFEDSVRRSPKKGKSKYFFVLKQTDLFFFCSLK